MTTTDKPLPAGEKQRLLQSSRALVFKWASVHFKSYLERLDEQFLRMADKAGSNQEQNRYLQSRNVIQQQRRAIEQQLLEHLRRAFERFLEQRPTAPDLTRADTELTLVDNDLLEQSIAVGTMTRRANADCAEALYALNQRLSVLAGGRKISDQGNPVTPAVFAEAVQSTLADPMLDTPSRLVSYKIFDNIVLGKLDKLFHLLNHYLKSEGVLSHLRYQVRKAENPPLPEELAAHNSAASLARQNDLMQLANYLLGRLSAPATHDPVPLQQLLDALGSLQQHSARALAGAAQPDAADADSTALASQIRRETRSAAPLDADTIEMVGLLFEYMLNDAQLPDAVKALLSHLHTPFLKVALLDKAFFNSPQHPARQLLNTLVAAGERWVEPEGKSRNDVLQQMKLVVQRILDEFDCDPRLFTQLAFEFSHYLHQHARRVRLAEQRAQQAARGEDTLKEVRARVERYLRRKVGEQTLPEAARTLLFEPWANFLAFNLLRFGSGSEQWRDAAQVVDDLLLYLNPARDPQRAWLLRDSLGARLQLGFQTVGYDDGSAQRLVVELHRAHQASASRADGAAPFQETGADIDVDEVPAPQRDPELERLGGVEFGTWFLFAADQPRDRQWRAKLAWSNNRTQHYMFVNSLGQQVALRDGADLADELRAGRARILENHSDKPFFERALERIVDQLRRRPQR